MKSIKKLIPILFLFMFFAVSASVGQPPPPDRGQDGDQAPQQEGPIGSGIAILLTLAGAYGAKKVYDARKKIRE